MREGVGEENDPTKVQYTRLKVLKKKHLKIILKKCQSKPMRRSHLLKVLEGPQPSFVSKW